MGWVGKKETINLAHPSREIQHLSMAGKVLALRMVHVATVKDGAT
jgi:hypothetical protein